MKLSTGRRIVQDLEYAKILRVENQLLKEDTTRFQFIIANKDSAINTYKTKEGLYSAIVDDKNKQIAIKEGENQVYVKKNKSLTFQRDALVVVILILLGFAIHK